MKTNLTNLASEIKKQRTVLSLTQDGLAQSARVNIRTVQRAEKAIKIGAYTLQRILLALNLDVLSTLKRFNGKNEEPQESESPKSKEFNPDRWLAEFQLRKAKHKLWGFEIREEIEEIHRQREQPDNDVPLEVLDARLEELDCANWAYQDRGEELSNEEDAINAFEWDTWEVQKEMDAWEREKEAEEREIVREMEFFGIQNAPALT